jgi:hypothetical protein
VKSILRYIGFKAGLRVVGAVTLAVVLAGSFAWSSSAAGETSKGFQLPPRSFPEEMPDAIFGVPVSFDAVSVLPFAGRQVLWFPVLMDDPSVPIEAVLLDPMQWGDKGEAQATVGRRSLWFMEPGSAMLYGVILDPASLHFEDVGVGYVIVKRLDEERYDVIVEDTNGNVLVAARGTHYKIDESIGEGTLIPAEDAEQQLVREQYGAQWPVGPEALFMFGIPSN